MRLQTLGLQTKRSQEKSRQRLEAEACLLAFRGIRQKDICSWNGQQMQESEMSWEVYVQVGDHVGLKNLWLLLWVEWEPLEYLNRWVTWSGLHFNSIVLTAALRIKDKRGKMAFRAKLRGYHNNSGMKYSGWSHSSIRADHENWSTWLSERSHVGIWCSWQLSQSQGKNRLLWVYAYIYTNQGESPSGTSAS